MHDVLSTIVQHKRQEIIKRKELHSEEKLWEAIQLMPPPRSLLKAIRGHSNTAFILECKKASPAQGTLRSLFHLPSIVAAYQPFASAISVITESRFFEGHLSYLRTVKERVDVPVLCKDFVVDPYMILEARFYGADSILLMASVLDDDALCECLAVCRKLGIDPLVEVHTSEELERILRLEDVKIIGINNRNLHTLDISLETTLTLAPRIHRENFAIVAESGIKAHSDIQRLRPFVDGFLIGSTLMRAECLEVALRQLIFGRVKVCGIMSADAAHMAYTHGATFCGLIFAPESPRAVTAQQAWDIIHNAPSFLEWVGVFVNEKEDKVAHLASLLWLRAVQLHGEETLAYAERLRTLLAPSTEIWKVFRVQDTGDLSSLWEEARMWLSSQACQKILLDTFSPEQRGGTGLSFNWDVIPSDLRPFTVLAGGINPDNVAAASRVGCYAVDVNSGVEDALGQKSLTKIKKLFDNLRG